MGLVSSRPGGGGGPSRHRLPAGVAVAMVILMTYRESILIFAVLLLLGSLAARAQQLPEAPQPTPQHQQAAYWSAVAATAALTAWDAKTTLTMASHGCPVEAWSPELYGKHPKAGRTIGVMGAEIAAAALVSWQLRRHHFHLGRLTLWSAPLGYVSYGHLSGAIHNQIHCQ